MKTFIFILLCIFFWGCGQSGTLIPMSPPGTFTYLPDYEHIPPNTNPCLKKNIRFLGRYKKKILSSWYSTSLEDNFSTTLKKWQGPYGEIKKPDYQSLGIEGALFSPFHKEPNGVIPIINWHSPSRKDNWMTTQNNLKGKEGNKLNPVIIFPGWKGIFVLHRQFLILV